MPNQNNIIVRQSAMEMADYLSSFLNTQLKTKGEGEFLTLAISGGSTPKQIFKQLSSTYKEHVDWNRIKFFWVDERCVSPDNDESNYKMTRINLFDNITISESNIFRIAGEEEPHKEAEQYGRIIRSHVEIENKWPRFDIILLGMGNDGHTASIFPGRNELFDSENYCKVATQPQTGQQRITLTGKVLNNASNVVFIVTGINKAKIVGEIINKTNVEYPASLVCPNNGSLTWLLDTEASRF